MAGKGIWWFKADLNVFSDQKVEDLIDEWGAAGAGVWYACMVELHAAINSGKPFLKREHLVRRVSCDLNMAREDAEEALDCCARVGLLDAEMWGEGKAANERVAARYEDYLAKRRMAEAARTAKANKTAGGSIDRPIS